MGKKHQIQKEGEKELEKEHRMVRRNREHRRQTEGAGCSDSIRCNKLNGPMKGLKWWAILKMLCLQSSNTAHRIQKTGK